MIEEISIALISGTVVALTKTSLDKSNKFFELTVQAASRIADARETLLNAQHNDALMLAEIRAFCQKVEILRKDIWILLTKEEQALLATADSFSASFIDESRSNDDMIHINEISSEYGELCGYFCQFASKVEERCGAQAAFPLTKWFAWALKEIYWGKEGGAWLLCQKIAGATTTRVPKVF